MLYQDSRPLRFIPLSSVLDALEFHPSSPSASDSDAPGPQTPTPKPNASPPIRLGSRRVLRKDDILTTPPSSKAKDKDRGENEHTFRLITAKRTFVLCAPSEEDEIKWLAAFRALLNRERGVSMSPTSEFAPRLPVPMTAIPTITQQSPTPALAIEQSPPPPATPALGTSQGPPILEREVPSPPPPPMTRGRSATYTAVSAVADVVRRFHPEQREAVH